jgi:hypothetical protein
MPRFDCVTVTIDQVTNRLKEPVPSRVSKLDVVGMALE